MTDVNPDANTPASQPVHNAAAGRLSALIASREATLAVVGLGYVGLPLLDAVAQAGFSAIGVDHDVNKITMLERGESYLPHLPVEVSTRLAGNSKVTLTDESRALEQADVVLLCVPTPLDDEHQPDLSYVVNAAHEFGACAVKASRARPRLIVLESSTHPGTTRDAVVPAVLKGAGIDAGKDGAVGGATGSLSASVCDGLFFAYSPEREDPGSTTHTTKTIPKLVGGTDAHSGALAVQLYEAIVDEVVPCQSAEVAEAAKLVENVYRSVNIALVNELKVILDKLGLDVWEVLDAASTKPFGFSRFNPGPGFGGHCVPIDPYYLSAKAREVGLDAKFIELAGEINRTMPGYVIGKLADAIAPGAIDSAKVLIIGVAYKKNVSDIRESPAFEIIEQLRAAGAAVSYHDPNVPMTHKGRRRAYELTSVALDQQHLQSADAVVVVTDHDAIDWQLIADHASLVIDTRNVMKNVQGKAHIVKA